MAFQLQVKCTNNRATYEALIVGLEILISIRIKKYTNHGGLNKSNHIKF